MGQVIQTSSIRAANSIAEFHPPRVAAQQSFPVESPQLCLKKGNWVPHKIILSQGSDILCTHMVSQMTHLESHLLEAGGMSQ